MKKCTILILILISMINCSGQNLINPTIDPNLLPAIKALTVQVVHHATPVDDIYPDYTEDDGTRLFENNAGVLIHLTKAAISWDHLELIVEGEDAECLYDFETEIELHHIENILDDDLMAMELATDNIADLAYCQFNLHFSAENDDSIGLDAVPEALGSTVYVAGSWDDGFDSGDFEISVTQDIEKTLTFMVKENGVTIEHPLHFEEGEDASAVTIGNMYDQWFNDIDFTASADEIKTKFIENFTAAMHQHLDDTLGTGGHH